MDLKERNKKAVDRAIKKMNLLKLTEKEKDSFLQQAGEAQLKVIKTSFTKETSPSGKAWEPLSFSYKKWKWQYFQGAKILELTGELQKSFSLAKRGTSIFISSTNDIAYKHQFGVKGKLKARPFMGESLAFKRKVKDVSMKFLKNSQKKKG